MEVSTTNNSRILCGFMNGPKTKAHLLETYSGFPSEITDGEIIREVTRTVVTDRQIRPLEFLDPTKLDKDDVEMKGHRYDWTEKDIRYTIWFPLLEGDHGFIERAPEGKLQMVAKKHAPAWMSQPKDEYFYAWCGKGITLEELMEQIKRSEVGVKVSEASIYAIASNVETYSHYVLKNQADSKLKHTIVPCKVYEWVVYQRSSAEDPEKKAKQEINHTCPLQTSWMKAYFLLEGDDSECVCRTTGEYYGVKPHLDEDVSIFGPE